MRSIAEGRPDIVFLDGYVSSAAIKAMIELSDVYVSLHRSEGYGLNLADAMAHGTPVIATGYSGNMDFMTAQTAELIGYERVEVGRGADPYPATAVWADPDLDAAAAAMRRLHDDPAYAASLAARAGRTSERTSRPSRSAARWPPCWCPDSRRWDSDGHTRVRRWRRRSVGGRRHVGDEAMLEALVRRLSAHGDYRFTIASVEPRETAESHGVQAVPRLRFDGLASQASLDRLDSIIDAALGDSSALGIDDAAWAVIRGVAAADAVVIAGGGNLSSIWPELILERVAIGRLAGVFSKPLVVSGQTVGPALSARDEALVAELLGRARFVGVCDDVSVDIVRRLGVPEERIFRTVDDAAFLVPAEADVVEWLPAGPYCLVTFSDYAGVVSLTEIVPAIARLLDHVADAGGLGIVFLPHEGVGADDTSGDGAAHRHIAAAMQQPSRTLPILPNDVSAELARRAALSVSSRYHPAAFAASAGVPALAVSVDDYTDNKLSGALGAFGQLEGLFSVISLSLGDVEAGFDRLWASRDAVRAQTADIAEARRAENDGWWAHLHGAISGTLDDATYRWSEQKQVVYLDDQLRTRSTRLRDWQRAAGAEWMATRIAARDRVAELKTASATQVSLEREAGQAVADRESALARIAELEVSLKAAQVLASRVADPMFARTHRKDARAMRWKAGARKAYRKLRRIMGR